MGGRGATKFVDIDEIWHGVPGLPSREDNKDRIRRCPKHQKTTVINILTPSDL